jgi:hypothetical protein
MKKYDGQLQRREYPISCKGITYRWVSDKDNSQADASNSGFRPATGEILAWLNSDDTYIPGTLASVVNIFSINPAVSLLYDLEVNTKQKGRHLCW